MTTKWLKELDFDEISKGNMSPEDILKDLGSDKKTLPAAIKEVVEFGILNWKTTKQFKANMKLVGLLNQAILDAKLIKLNTFSGLLVSIRKLARAAFGETHEKLIWFQPGMKNIGLNMTETQFLEVEQVKSDVVSASNKTQITVSMESIELLSKSLSDIPEPTMGQKLVLLQLAVGCRKIELLNPAVSSFKIDPKNSRQIIQKGVAKLKNKEILLGITREVKKPVLGITPERFLELLAEIRAEVAEDNKTLGVANNVKLGNRYAGHITRALKPMLKIAGFPKDFLPVSHNLRKLWVNYSHKRYSRGQSLISYIGQHLGHSEKGLSLASQNYSVINIESGTVLSNSQAARVISLENDQTSTKDTIEKLKEKLKKMEKALQAAPDDLKRVINVNIEKKPDIQKNNLETNEKFKVIETLLAKGYSSYSDLQKQGITTYMLSKYKKAHNIKGEIEVPAGVVKPATKKKKIVVNDKKISVAEAAAKLTKLGKSHSYNNFRTQFRIGTNSMFSDKEIREWKASQ